MLVYQCGFGGEPGRRPLTDHSNPELREHLRNIATGNISESLYDPQDVREQVLIILFAREMGWL